jgi:hypothetical protein
MKVKKLIITRDSTGVAVWPDMPLDYREQGDTCQYSDPECEYRGGETLYDLVEDVLLGRELKVGEKSEFIVVTEEESK